MFDIKKLKEESERYATIRERRHVKSLSRQINHNIKKAVRSGAKFACLREDIYEKPCIITRIRATLARFYTEHGFKVNSLEDPYDIALKISWED